MRQETKLEEKKNKVSDKSDDSGNNVSASLRVVVVGAGWVYFYNAWVNVCVS